MNVITDKMKKVMNKRISFPMWTNSSSKNVASRGRNAEFSEPR